MRTINIDMTKIDRQRFLQALRACDQDSVSGEELAQTFGVSRAAIWKTVQALRADGYDICATTNRGYRLVQERDCIDAEQIACRLGGAHAPIYVYDSLESTNRTALELADDGAPHGTIVLARRQTQGRGRIGRSFHSPDGGIYMSVVLRPQCRIAKATLITPAAAVAVTRALRELCGLQCGIKWVNDLYLRGKKVCGILTQAQTDFETGVARAVVVGIGINFSMPEGGFPTDLADKAGALFESDAPITRNALIARIVWNLLDLTADPDHATFMDDYRAASVVIGKQIRYTYDNVPMRGVAIDIDDAGGLVVQEDNGVRTLTCGEISVQSVDGAWQ